MSEQTEEQWMSDMLMDIAVSGVAFDDSRLGYVEVQIDRATWDEIQEWKKSQA